MEDNKLIASFMGMEFSYFSHAKGEYYRPINYCNDWNHVADLKYNKSWDWLIPVVIEIKRTGGAHELIDQIDFALTCDCTLENVYKSVLEFIKTYNNGI